MFIITEIVRLIGLYPALLLFSTIGLCLVQTMFVMIGMTGPLDLPNFKDE